MNGRASVKDGLNHKQLHDYLSKALWKMGEAFEVFCGKVILESIRKSMRSS